MTRELIKPKANIIAALAENMKENDWSSEILSYCTIIRKALDEIEKIAHVRESGER